MICIQSHICIKFIKTVSPFSYSIVLELLTIIFTGGTFLLSWSNSFWIYYLSFLAEFLIFCFIWFCYCCVGTRGSLFYFKPLFLLKVWKFSHFLSLFVVSDLCSFEHLLSLLSSFYYEFKLLFYFSATFCTDF